MERSGQRYRAGRSEEKHFAEQAAVHDEHAQLQAGQVSQMVHQHQLIDFHFVFIFQRFLLPPYSKIFSIFYFDVIEILILCC